MPVTKPTAVHAIQDDMAPPFLIMNPSTTTLPTDARIRQKSRLTKQFTEPDIDISGLGPEAITLSNEVIWETADFSGKEPQEVYPTTGITTEDYRERFTLWSSRLPTGGMGCPTCHSSLRKDSSMHMRNPATCSHPNIVPVYWDCPGYRDDRGRNPRYTDPGHNYQDGKCRFAHLGPPPRTGAHPRDPRTPATNHPSADISGYDATVKAERSGDLRGDAPPEAYGEQGGVPPAASGSSTGPHEDLASVAGDAPRAGRDPDQHQRVRRTETITGTSPATMPDWSRFNIQVRYPKMSHIQLSAVDEIRLAMIQPITDICRECRAWQKHGNVNMPSLSLPTKFNEQGLYGQCSGPIPYRYHETLLNAYCTSWFQIHGPFQALYSDGELGLNNQKTIQELKYLGTELRIRAPDQHAQTAEARQSMLRHVMHKIKEDLKRHNHQIPFCRLYAEAIVVVNAFLFYHGVSPYNAHTGRQSALLSDFRPCSEAITQSTAVAKFNVRTLPLKTNTTIDGSRLNKPGDFIDYHRLTATKDEDGGWNGPCPVIRSESDRGKVVCKHGGKELAVRYPDARLTLFMDDELDNDAMDTILNYISRLQAGKTLRRISHISKDAPKVFLALQYSIRNSFRMSDVYAIRLGKGVANVSRCEHAECSVLIYYNNDNDPDFHYYDTKDTALDTNYITHSGKSRIIQCLVKMHDQPPIDPAGLTTTSPSAGPSTSSNIGGDLPTIPEETGELDADELIIESFYAELMSDHAIPDVTDGVSRYEEMRDPAPPLPVHTMPENSVLFWKCKLNQRQFINCGVWYTMQPNHDVVSDLDEYIKTLRPSVSSELTGAAAEKEATTTVADLFVSLRGAAACTTLTRTWIQVYIVALQRVQVPTNLCVRCLNTITRKLHLHIDSGYRRITEAEDVKGYGMCGRCRLPTSFAVAEVDNQGPAIHLLDNVCRSHRLCIKSSSNDAEKKVDLPLRSCL